MTETVRITNQQARRFLLLKHGLIGPYRFYGKQGILDFVGQAGCIQFDPVDTCGKNAELVLQSRVKDFRKDQLYDLLYTDRDLFDYFDKNLAILRTEDWPHCCRIRVSYREGCRSHREVDAVRATIIERIRKQGPVCSADLEFDTKVAWFWQDTRLSRAALETLYFRGDLVVHHKEGTIKYYDLAERCLAPELLDAPDPFADDAAYAAWRVLRRIGSVGLLWNRASDAWLGEGRLKSGERGAIFDQLLGDRKILAVHVAGMKDPLYCVASDRPLLDVIRQDTPLAPRCELLAPLDNLLWDRRLIRSLFGFNYTWEIYTPASKRRYGTYVLPLLFGDRFTGRLEAVCDRKEKNLVVRRIWYETDVQPDSRLQEAVGDCLQRFARFNGCSHVVLAEGSHEPGA